MAQAITPNSSRSGTPPPSEIHIPDKMADVDTEAEFCSTPSNKMAELDCDVNQDKSCGSSAEGATSVESAIDRLLQKQRNELMFELRRMQHGDRPVTGQGNKEAVEQFFTRALHSDTEEAAGAREQNRPENVVIEVNALVERRPVSSALQSAGFRRSLENALRGAIGSGLSRPRPNARAEQQRPESSRVRPVPAPRTALSTGGVTNDLEARQNNHAEAAPETRNTQPLQHATTQEQPNRTWRRQVPQSQRVRSVRVTESLDTEDTTLPDETQSSVTAAQAWLQQSPHHSPAGQDSPWGRIENAHREELIMDISELVQRQLVTDTLNGNFRTVLERRMNERLESSGADGRRIQQFVQSLPQSTFHVRNDFSDLGINVPDVGENQSISDHLDEVSVISATAAMTVPYAQSNLAMSRELKSLKNQMKEMMNMMKLNFDLTMDVQRSVRQEVAAAMNHQNNGTETHSGASSRPVNDTRCLICLDKAVDTVLYQCGHMCVCYTCGMTLRQRGGATCPVCRAPIKDIIRAYRCNATDEP